MIGRSMNLNDYMARIEQAVRDNVAGSNGRVLGIVEYDMNEREGYWERIYIVAWSSEREAGTHHVNIDSNGAEALFYGHYQLSEVDAVFDMIERANLTPGRI